MTALTFGTTLKGTVDVAPFARRAEELGFDLLGCGEHVMFHAPAANTFVSLSVAAGATERIKLMSTILLLPLYPAALAAKMGAALDVASNGRYCMGVGVGGEFPKEFEACGVPVNQRGARTNEALEVITKLWTESNVSFEGRYTTLNEVTLSPGPIQKPHPPIWVAGRGDAAMRRVARYGDGWLPYMYTPEQLHESLDTIHTYQQDFGREASDMSAGVFIFTTIDADGDKARAMCNNVLSTQYAQDFSKRLSRYALAGTPEDCQKRLQEYIDAGARTIILSGASTREYDDENLRMIAEELIPALR